MRSLYFERQWGKAGGYSCTNLRPAMGVRAPGALARLEDITEQGHCARSRHHLCPEGMAWFPGPRMEDACAANQMWVGAIGSAPVSLSV